MKPAHATIVYILFAMSPSVGVAQGPDSALTAAILNALPTLADLPPGTRLSYEEVRGEIHGREFWLRDGGLGTAIIILDTPALASLLVRQFRDGAARRHAIDEANSSGSRVNAVPIGLQIETVHITVGDDAASVSATWTAGDLLFEWVSVRFSRGRFAGVVEVLSSPDDKPLTLVRRLALQMDEAIRHLR